MINVLFVCLGNICRSPVAEGVFRTLVEEKGLSDQIQCDSAGTSSYHLGQLPDRRTRENALEHNLTLTHRARRLTGEDLAQFTHFVAMDEQNLEAVEKLHYRSTGLPNNDTIFLLREFDPDVSDDPNVPDPYYEGPDVFEDVYQITLRCCRQLLSYLIQQDNRQLLSE
ncbi:MULTISPECIES: low molecular weight protein-tyrosine-phosphatase [Spirosoma]|uniref:protein-tyrosine-phosphatase n=1 Tax=Spirosoma liriopis TaxID=2937440 RepID=A0ABT0HEQ0_9BACT|nr:MULTISPECIES: low molecular weight protein-tyrosine-phosphatase [Spirosoma]MCK8490639.1 low molecular weight phosphotyrosine protein phosphatase [Spirosoma liriopis]UHG90000.1 low molecular weight phosphotyrosine protein phosphatase [Spirosoma oryzicola]